MKRKRPKNAFLGHLNSIKNKFDSVWELIKDTFDIFLLSESKLDSSFPNDQFSIPAYQIVRKARNRVFSYYFLEDYFCTSMRTSPLK